jgi:hypothetical protein
MCVSSIWHMKDREHQILPHEAGFSAGREEAPSQIQGQAKLKHYYETKQERSGPRIVGEKNEVNNWMYL